MADWGRNKGNTRQTTQREDLYLVKVLLAASKKAITRRWYKAEPPTYEQWLSIVEDIFVMEKLIHNLRLQEEQFLETTDIDEGTGITGC